MKSRVAAAAILRLTGEAGAAEAGRLIAAGGIVAFPTETVYGLGCDCFQSEAVAGIYELKGRPLDNPTIIHVSAKKDLKRVSSGASEVAEALAGAFWPGPLTLVLSRHPEVPQNVSAALSTVAVRMPNHPLALKMIETAGTPVAAPSANISGRPSPTSADHVVADFHDGIAAILDGGNCTMGIESTVLDLTSERAQILRPGTVTIEELEAVLGYAPEMGKGNGSPGTRHRHYQPRCIVRLFSGFPPVPRSSDGLVTLTSMPHPSRYSRRINSIEEYARAYYAILREADEVGVERLYLERPMSFGVGIALLDRMTKSSERI